MGVHVTLTGVRGLLAPVGAILLYDRFGSGKWVFAVCLALNIIGAIGFVALARHRSVPTGVPDERPA
jgi:hypothetical protein